MNIKPLLLVLSFALVLSAMTEIAYAAQDTSPDFDRYCREKHPGSFVNSFKYTLEPICTIRKSNLELLHHRIDIGEACRMTLGSSSFRQQAPGKYLCISGTAVPGTEGRRQTGLVPAPLIKLKPMPKFPVKDMGVGTRFPPMILPRILPVKLTGVTVPKGLDSYFPEIDFLLDQINVSRLLIGYSFNICDQSMYRKGLENQQTVWQSINRMKAAAARLKQKRSDKFTHALIHWFDIFNLDYPVQVRPLQLPPPPASSCADSAWPRDLDIKTILAWRSKTFKHLGAKNPMHLPNSVRNAALIGFPHFSDLVAQRFPDDLAINIKGTKRDTVDQEDKSGDDDKIAQKDAVPAATPKRADKPKTAPGPAEPTFIRSTDRVTGITTEVESHPDGSRTITKTDKDGNLLSKQMLPPPEKGSASGETVDPDTGIKTRLTQSADGSQVIQRRDTDGNLLSETEQDEEGTFIRSYDRETGEVTTVKPGPDGRPTIVRGQREEFSESDGTRHVTEIDEDGNEVYTVISPDGTRTVHQDDEHGHYMERTHYSDGRLLTRQVDGASTELRQGEGYSETIERNAKGETLAVTQQYKDGRVVKRGQRGDGSGFDTITTTPHDDGSVTTRQIDQYGNRHTVTTDAKGAIISQDENIVKPKEPGQRYYEERIAPATGGRWEELPDYLKMRMVSSERDIERRLEEQKRRDQLERERQVKAREDAIKLAQWQDEQERRRQEMIQGQERRAVGAEKRYKQRRNKLVRAETLSQMNDIHRKAAITGWTDDLRQRYDALNDQYNVLMLPSDEEQAAIDKRFAQILAIEKEVTSRAAGEIYGMQETTRAYYEARSNIGKKTKWVSIGEEMHLQSEKSLLNSQLQIDRAIAKKKVVEQIQSDPDRHQTTVEREALQRIIDRADTQIRDNQDAIDRYEFLKTIGYGTDIVTMGVSGATASKGVSVTGKGLERVATSAAKAGLPKTTAALAKSGQVLRYAGEKGITAVAKDIAGRGASQATQTVAKTLAEQGAVDITKTLVDKPVRDRALRILDREVIDQVTKSELDYLSWLQRKADEARQAYGSGGNIGRSQVQQQWRVQQQLANYKNVLDLATKARQAGVDESDVQRLVARAMQDPLTTGVSAQDKLASAIIMRRGGRLLRQDELGRIYGDLGYVSSDISQFTTAEKAASLRQMISHAGGNARQYFNNLRNHYWRDGTHIERVVTDAEFEVLEGFACAQGILR